MSTINSVVCSRTLRGRTPCFIWEQMLSKRSATRLRPGGMDVDSGGDIICCGLQSLLNPPKNFGNHSPIGTSSHPNNQNRCMNVRDRKMLTR